MQRHPALPPSTSSRRRLAINWGTLGERATEVTGILMRYSRHAPTFDSVYYEPKPYCLAQEKETLRDGLGRGRLYGPGGDERSAASGFVPHGDRVSAL